MPAVRTSSAAAIALVVLALAPLSDAAASCRASGFGIRCDDHSAPKTDYGWATPRGREDTSGLDLYEKQRERRIQAYQRDRDRGMGLDGYRGSWKPGRDDPTDADRDQGYGTYRDAIGVKQPLWGRKCERDAIGMMQCE